MTLETCPTCRGMGQWLNQPVCPECNGTGDVWTGGRLFPVIAWTPELKADAEAFRFVADRVAAEFYQSFGVPPALLGEPEADAPHVVPAS